MPDESPALAVTPPLTTAGRARQTVASASANPDAPEPYEFGGEIARGGMGSIIEAADCKLGRTVAVKVMLSEMEGDAEKQRRFINEAAVLATLEHPNIVPIHDLGRDPEGQLYYTMKLVQGHTLQAILNGLRGGESTAASHYTLNSLLTIFRKVCDALAFAHSRGIIHRDLKPENIMVGEFGEVLVMDWGLAKNLNAYSLSNQAPAAGARPPGLDSSVEETVISSASDSVRRVALRRVADGSHSGMTLEGDVMGTPQYMSPEQAQGRIADIDARSDIYSLGGILYAILTLRPPVEGKTLDEVLQKVGRGESEPLASPKSETGARRWIVPSALAAVVMKAMSADKAKRYPDVPAFSADVEAYQNGFATSAENASALRQLVLLMKRHKGVTVSLLVLLLASIGFVIKVTESEQTARQSLAELRATAPTFFDQAKLLTAQQKLPEALEKIDIALKLTPDHAGFHAQRGNILQSMERFAEAARAYDAAAKLNAQESHAADNATLSRTLATAKQKDGELSVNTRTQWRDALMQQGRAAEAIFAGQSLVTDAEKMLPAWQEKIDAWLGNHGTRVKLVSGGKYDLDLSYHSLTDITSLRGMPLRSLTIDGNQHLRDLSPLVDCPLEELHASKTGELADLSPLKGKKLVVLEMPNSGVHDLNPLAGMPLETVVLGSTTVTSIEPLRGTKLTFLDLRNTAVTDLAPLRGQPLINLNLSGTQVTSLEPVGDAPLVRLDIHGFGRMDLAALRQRHLQVLYADGRVLDHLDVLAQMSQLETVILPVNFFDPGLLRNLRRLRKVDFVFDFFKAEEQLKSAADFFRQYDAPPVRAVRSALAKAGMLNIVPMKNIDLDPAGHLRVNLSSTSVVDLSPLHGLPIQELGLSSTAVTDLRPLQGMPLQRLHISATSLSSLVPLLGLPLVRVELFRTRVRDVGMLAEFPDLESAQLPENAINVERLRTLKKLRYLSTRWNGNEMRAGQTVDEFWKEYDARKAPK